MRQFPRKDREEEAWIGTEEIDRILDRTYNANKKDKDAGATNGYKKKRIIESSPLLLPEAGSRRMPAWNICWWTAIM